MSTTPNDDDEWFSLEPIEPKKESPKKDSPKPKPADPKDTPRSVFDEDLPELVPLPASAPTPKATPKPASATASKPACAQGSSASSLPPSLPPASKPSASTPAASKPDPEYSIGCQVCKSILSVQASQVGKQVRCPDCHSMLTVPARPVKKPAQATPIDQLASVDLAPVEGTDPRTASGASLNTKAMLNKASKEIERDREQIEAVSRAFDSKEWLSRTFGFLSDSRLILALTLIGLASAICFYVGTAYGHLFVTHNVSHGFRSSERTIATSPEQINASVYRIVTALVNLLMILPLAATFVLAVAIIPKAANRLKRIDPWPFMANLRDYAAPAAVSAGVWYTVHVIGTTLSMPLGILRMPIAIQEAFAEFVPWLLLPIIYLSMLEKQSLKQPFSQSVFRSISARPDAWGAMYMQTGIGFVLLFAFTQVGILQGPAFFAVVGFLIPWFLCFLANQYGVLAGRVSDVTELGYEGDFSESE